MDSMQPQWTLLESPNRLDSIDHLQYGKFIGFDGKFESAMQPALSVYKSGFAQALHHFCQISDRYQCCVGNQGIRLWFCLVGKVDYCS